MNKFLRRGVSAVLAAGVVGAAIWAPLSTAQNEDTYMSLKLFGDVFDTVRANYVEEVDDEALHRGGLDLGRRANRGSGKEGDQRGGGRSRALAKLH